MKRCADILISVILVTAISSCMKWDYGLDQEETVACQGHGLFIACEGNYQYGNATLSYYNPSTRTVDNEAFCRANGMKLGDVVQSMTLHNGKLWTVVNNSHVIFAVDAENLRETGRIENLTSPRYIHFVTDRKAYVTQLYDNRIFIVDPSDYSITGFIPTSSRSTEQIVEIGRYVFCNCWSYQNKILKIDTTTDVVTDSLTVGMQPQSMATDCNGRLWVLTDGGYEGSPMGNEAPTLLRINAQTMTVEQRFELPRDSQAKSVCTNAAADTVYWICDDVWRMPVNATELPREPFIPYRGTRFYELTVSPYDSDVYVADAIDYQQNGKIYRYDSCSHLIDEFYVGITPGGFCWK